MIEKVLMELENITICPSHAVQKLKEDRGLQKVLETNGFEAAVAYGFGKLAPCIDTDTEKIYVTIFNPPTNNSELPVLDGQIWNAIWDKSDLVINPRPYIELLIYREVQIPEDTNDDIRFRLEDLKKQIGDRLLVVIRYM